MIYYFGYGAYADEDWVRNAIGHKPGKKIGAMVRGYNLAIQKVGQLAESVRKVISAAWDDDFLIYSLIPGKGYVSGVLWTLTETDLSCIKKREIFPGWRTMETVNIILYDGTEKTAYTDLIEEGQNVFGRIDGLIYPFLLNPEKGTIPRGDTKDVILTKQKIAQIQNNIKGMMKTNLY